MAFGGSVKLTGESEYKKALGSITDGLKVMSSEMQKVTAQYGNNDTSIDGLTAKNKVLNDQIDKQKEKVSILAQALSEARQETGDNSSTTQKWQTELNKAEAELTSMNKSVSNNEQLMKLQEEATRKGYGSIEEYAKATEQAEQKSTIFWENLKANLSADFIKSGLKALADGVSNVANSFNDMLKSGAGYGDNILTQSVQTGLSTEALQKYNAISELVDVSTETLTGSMAKNIKSMSSGADAYQKLGVSVKDANGNLRDSDTVYWETIDALGKVSNETERNALSMDIFGKSAQDLNPLIAQGSEGIKELGEEAKWMGAVLSEEGLGALGDLDDSLQLVSASSKSTGNILASAFAPAMSSMLTGVYSVTGAFNGLINAVLSGDGTSIEQALTQFSKSINFFINEIGEQVPKMLEIGTNLVTQLVTAITNNLPMIIEAGVKALNSLLTGISTNLSKILPVVIKALMTLVNGLIANLPVIIDAGLQILLALIKGIGDSLPTLIPTIVNAVITIVETLLDNIDLIIDAGISILLGLVDGIINALPQLIDKIPVIIDKLINAITDNLPKLIEAGITITIAVAGGLIKAIPQLISKLPQIIGSIVSGLLAGLGQIAEVGKNMVVGLWNGINNAKDWVLDKIKSFGKSILDGIKSFFGIHSPSTVFKDQIGKNLALGVGEGFTEGMGKVVDDMQKALPTEFDLGLNTSLNQDVISNLSNASSSISDDRLIGSLQNALKGMAFKVDSDKFGELVINNVEKVVYS